jgi:hypothetical protein
MATVSFFIPDLIKITLIGKRPKLPPRSERNSSGENVNRRHLNALFGPAKIELGWVQ